jgi:hypothetical protein
MDVSAGSVIGRAWEIYKRQFVTLFAVAAGVSLVTLLAGLLLGVLSGVVSVIVDLFFVGAVVNLVKDLEDGRRDEELSALFAGVAPVFWRLLAVAILCGLAIAIGFVLIIVPGLILITIWSVAVPVCVLERPGVFASFGRSRALVRGHGWSVFLTIVLAWLITIGIAIVGGIIAAPLGDAGRAIVDWVISALTLPLSALVMSVLYFRLLGGRADVPAQF